MMEKLLALAGGGSSGGGSSTPAIGLYIDQKLVDIEHSSYNDGDPATMSITFADGTTATYTFEDGLLAGVENVMYGCTPDDVFFEDAIGDEGFYKFVIFGEGE